MAEAAVFGRHYSSDSIYECVRRRDGTHVWRSVGSDGCPTVNKADWSRETFGPGDRYSGVIEHIRRELKEIEANPSDLTEWVDVIFLAMDGAWRSSGADGEAIVRKMLEKHKINRERRWPDWRSLGADGVSEHVKDEE